MKRGAWAEANEIAGELGVGYIGTDILLLGLIRAGGVAAEVLAQAGATEDAVAEIVRRTSGSSEPPGDRSDPDQPRPTPAAEHARGRAEGFATALDIQDGSVALLLALVYDRHGIHGSAFRQLRVDRGALIERLAAQGFAVPSKPPAPYPAPHSEAVILKHDHAMVVIEELAKRTVAAPELWFDAWGGGSWGYGAVTGRPDHTRISGEPRIHLRDVIPEILAANGLPVPPDDAWETAGKR